MKSSSSLTLNTPISNMFMVGPTYAKRLQKLEIASTENLIYHFPFRYEDYSLISKIALLQPGETVTIQGNVISMKNIYTKYGKKIQQAQISDDSGTIEVIWYNQPFLIRTIRVGEPISLSGKVGWFGKKIILESPVYEILRPTTIHTGRLVPIYPETYGISSKWLRSRISFILPRIIPQVEDFLPVHIQSKYNFYPLPKAIQSIHFPQTKMDYVKARERLAFDELFLLQVASLKRKMEWQKETVGNPFKISPFKKEIQKFWEKLPFELTNAQKRAVKEIFSDLAGKIPMNRLLQGDVGSGKTVVATIAAYLSHLNGYQSAIMAPTEILAKQHYQTISNILKLFGLKIGLFTGSEKPKEKGANSFNIYIGTHALLAEKLEFQKLGLVVIDEQHRFGVEQRAKLKEKGINPHLLSMTATPIPRTVTLTVYGELDLSVIDEMPKGRQKIKTWVVPPEKRDAAYRWIEEQINPPAGGQNTQAFIICPLIEESETFKTVKAAKKEFEKLKKEIFPKLKLALLHGRLKLKEKEHPLGEFRNGKVDILVSTPVVEVGIDVPNATIMVIEAAERYGLAQLHQLRGRVGRSDKQSYCLIFSESQSEDSYKRLKFLERTYIGMELAEIDLRLRGPGEIYGTRQHGIPKLKIASYNNLTLIETAKEEALNLLEKDPDLHLHPLLKNKIEILSKASISPN